MKSWSFKLCLITLCSLLPIALHAPESYAKKKAKGDLTLGNVKTSDIKVKGHKVFVGEEGLTITVVELANPAEHFLLEVKSSGTNFDQQVLVHKLQSHDGGRRYSYDTIFKGEDYSTLFTEKDWWGNTIFFQNPTNYAKKFPLYYSDKETKAAKPDAVVSRYAGAGKK